MLGGQTRVAEKAQGDPAGQPLGLGAGQGLDLPVVGGVGVGRRYEPRLDRLAGLELGLAPP